jgi:alginate O-acetyltransferase complex protein AlgI
MEWILARQVKEASAATVRRLWLWASVILNLGLLAFFKYAHFFLPQLQALVSSVGFRTQTLEFLVPVGISFWTLQKMTLTLDVYFHRIKRKVGFFEFLLSTAFFPTLVSGPIDRVRNLLPQWKKDRTWDAHRFSEGVWLIAIGAFQKVVIADNVARCVDSLLKPGESVLAIQLGLWAYALQIFADFSGYSDMARGIARLFGVELLQNFQAPYASPNLSEFWKRWHVALSSWLNDYIFSPTSMWLRDWGTTSVVVATWVTFTVSGLWHGTGWNFLAWGAVHAVGLTAYTLTKKERKKYKKRWGKSVWLEPLMIAVTFEWVCLGYLFFEASSLGEVRGLLTSAWDGHWLGLPKCDLHIIALSAVAVVGLHWTYLRNRDPFWIFTRSVTFRTVVYLVLGLLLLRFYAPAEKFLYFQF